MNDDVVFQRGSPLPENEHNDGSQPNSGATSGENHDLASPKVFDFSSDLNISAVSDENGYASSPSAQQIKPGEKIYIKKVPPKIAPASRPQAEQKLSGNPASDPVVKPAPSAAAVQPSVIKSASSDIETNFTPPAFTPQQKDSVINKPVEAPKAVTPPQAKPATEIKSQPSPIPTITRPIAQVRSVETPKPVQKNPIPATAEPKPLPPTPSTPVSVPISAAPQTPPAPKTPPKIPVITTVRPVEPPAPSKNILASDVPPNLPGATPSDWPFASQTTAGTKESANKVSQTEKEEAAQEFKAITQESMSANQWKPKTHQPTPVPDKVDIKNLRTYETDIADALSHRGTSKLQMSLAESKRRGEGETIRNNPEPVTGASRVAAIMSEPAQGAPRHSGKKLVLVLVSLLLIGAGSVGGYFLYTMSPLAPKKGQTVTNGKTLPSIIPADAQAVIATDVNKDRLAQLIKAEVSKTGKDGIIKEIVFTQNKDGVDYRVSALEMAALLNIPIPDIIARTLMPQWMLGTYSDALGQHSFVAVTTNLFQNAFAGMLQWEPTMVDDLKEYITSREASSGTFKDKIVRNKDVRAFVTPTGQTLFLYSFIDNSTLVIAENEATLHAIVARLESKAFVR